MGRQWNLFKEHFIVEHLPLVGSLEDVVDWYFRVEPPFSEKKRKEFPDGFILSAIEGYHREQNATIAVVSADGDFERACATRPYIAHYADLKTYVDAFKPELSYKDRMPEPVDPTQPIVTEDLTELKAILGRGSQATSLEIDRAVKLLRTRGENYRYFFLNVNDPLWLHELQRTGFSLMCRQWIGTSRTAVCEFPIGTHPLSDAGISVKARRGVGHP